ncbi:MAG TPA: hypothetical protein VM686_03730 [Polyangiaceae bacterium]|nr:hypothetical protein [Polyangiaceae bacterium]
MGKGLPRSSARGAAARQDVIRQTITVSNLALLVDGATGVGWNSVVAGDLPEGNILLLGAVSYLQFTAGGTISTTFDGDYSIGTTATADATLASGDIDIIPSTPLGAATASVSPRVRGVMTASVCGTTYDNTDGSLELNLNLLIDDANISADNEPVTANGVIHLAYIVLGDD